MKYLAIDIETIPSQSLPESCIPQFDPSEVKIGNLKDPEKIKAKIAEEQANFEASKNKTMSLDPALCQLCTFCGVLYDTEDGIIEETTYQLTESPDDYDLVLNGWGTIIRAQSEKIPLVSFNGIQFDLPVMLFRAIKNDVPINTVQYKNLTAKYNNNHHYDVMQLLAGWDRQSWHGLEFYLNLFKLGNKGDMDGSKVYTAYQAEEYDKIREYCRNDVLTLCQLFNRIRHWFLTE
jgi:hypothetical protein